MRTFFLKPIVPDLDNANEGSTTLIITFLAYPEKVFFIIEKRKYEKIFKQKHKFY